MQYEVSIWVSSVGPTSPNAMLVYLGNSPTAPVDISSSTLLQVSRVFLSHDDMFDLIINNNMIIVVMATSPTAFTIQQYI